MKCLSYPSCFSFCRQQEEEDFEDVLVSLLGTFDTLASVQASVAAYCHPPFSQRVWDRGEGQTLGFLPGFALRVQDIF